MADSLVIKVVSGFIDGRDSRGRYKYQYQAKIVITSSIDLIPFVVYHFKDDNGRVIRQHFVNKYPRITIGTPTPQQLFKTILPIIAVKLCKLHYSADELGVAIAKAIIKKYRYRYEIQDYTPDMIKIKLIPR